MVRLEQLLGRALDDLDWETLQQLYGVSEDVDLDYKRDHYGSSDSDKRALAVDVAAMANTSGGLILIGMSEDDQARADLLAPVRLSDSDVSRYRSIVARQVFPLPRFETMLLPSKEHEGQGALLVFVKRSTAAPHAVQLDDSLRYPRRNGRTTYYLREAEVADAYRRRIASVASSTSLLRQRATQFVQTLDDDQRWLTMSVVPDTSGEFVVNRSSFEQFSSRVVNQPALMPWYGVNYSRPSVGFRCLRADFPAAGTKDSRKSSYCALQLNSDGSGSYGAELHDLSGRTFGLSGAPTQLHIFEDEALVGAVLCGLQQLARHAWESGAGGGLSVACTIWPVNDSRPIAWGQARNQRIGTRGQPANDVPHVEAYFALDELASDGTGLVRAGYVLLRDIAQCFGLPEVGQISSEGEVRLQYWSSGVTNSLIAWCEQRGIAMTTESA